MNGQGPTTGRRNARPREHSLPIDGGGRLVVELNAEEAGKLKRGMKVAMVAFGSGFTWGSAILEW